MVLPHPKQLFSKNITASLFFFSLKQKKQCFKCDIDNRAMVAIKIREWSKGNRGVCKEHLKTRDLGDGIVLKLD